MVLIEAMQLVQQPFFEKSLLKMLDEFIMPYDIEKKELP